ncbi:MAG: hypothetical protein IPO48_04510 [Saprospiraceae bacterium]|nr:hypothetical protein [Saprospiraceae bacterium]
MNTDVELMFGVDSTRCSSGAQTGALDPAKGLFWSWSSGYIMVKAEGNAPTAADGSFAFHLGGFKGVNKVQTTKSYNFGSTALVVDGDRELRFTWWPIQQDYGMEQKIGC